MRRAQKFLFLTVALSLVVAGLSVSRARTMRPETPGTQNNRDASTLFKKNCATCHGQDGRAKTVKAKFNHARDLTDAAWQREVTDERIFNSITNGKGKMPSFGRKLSEAEINSLVHFVRQLSR
ncbi:MAG TPA: cytochrome c [Pyrinomonadaceae bacterium]|nr:cytochrome c [Pyrinomonadaceae bacterium]